MAAAHGAWRRQWQRQPHEKLRGVWGSGSAQGTKQQRLACCPGSGDDLNGDGMDSIQCCCCVCGGRRSSLSLASLFLKTLKGVCLCPAACLLGCCRKRRTMNGFLHQGIGLLKTLNAIVFSPGGGERKHLHWRAGKKLVRL